MAAEISPGVALLASLTVVSVSALLAFGRHKSQKSWEEKYAAYQDMFAALHAIKYWAEQTSASLLALPTISRDGHDKLRRDYEMAKERLSKYIFLGQLLMAERTVDAMDTLFTEVSRAEFDFEEYGQDSGDYSKSYLEHCDAVQGIINRHLPILMKLAKRDLR